MILFLGLALTPRPAAALDWTRDPVAQMSLEPAGAPSAPAAVPAPIVLPPAAAVERLDCRPEIIAAFKEAWRMAGSGNEEYEAAFRIDRGADGYEIEFMPMTREPYELLVKYSLKNTVAIVHTHPDTAHRTPGPGDYASKVPNFVISKTALYVTIPGTKRHRLVRRDWKKPCDVEG